MKKFLVLLLISIMAIFVFAGCDGIIDDGAEGEGEGEGEIEGVTIEIDGAYEVGGVKYIKGDKKYDVTVTFPAPVENVEAWLTDCLGDQSKATYPLDTIVILVPNEDKTVWSGSMKSTLEGADELCCAVKLVVEAGECDWCEYVETIVVDSASPYLMAEIEIEGGYDVCPCGGCSISVSSVTSTSACDPDEECCGDSCSGLAGWSVSVFDEFPWDICCDTGCEEPIFTDSGVGCPVEFTIDCLDPNEDNTYYYAAFFMEDNVGNETQVAFQFKIIDEVDGCCFTSIEWDPASLNMPSACDYDTPELCEFEYDPCYNDATFYVDPDMSNEDCNDICDEM
jgi:hypothetical protein